ncbi:hypothetical protein [Candidatus Laterigemmans baculatus]|uniref:hypothetical protein n=1 Tax=Candidatus Laterigemmans baculatus TaxID=2770505 RepID=UPI0013DCA4BC|nr:hypothetical protein [Candidatus Laterigemmans baculatus]
MSLRAFLNFGWSIALLGLVLCSGCGYPRVSPAAFETAKVVENLCNLETAPQIPQARALVAEQLRSGEITPDEAALLEEILDEAEAGDWATASEQARQLLEAQNEYP